MEKNMTYMISDEVRPLLQPAQFHVAREIALTPRIVPDSPGIYGWWFDDAISDVPSQDSLLVGGRRLLYVGIAPSGARGTSGKRSLRDRLKNHCRGPIAHSTFRRTIVALIGAQLRLAVYRQPNGKLGLADDGESRLTEWMSTHLRVAWMVHAHPWKLEEALIKSGPRLPLNIMGSDDEFARILKERRASAHIGSAAV
jgi:hypothetical protein